METESPNKVIKTVTLIDKNTNPISATLILTQLFRFKSESVERHYALKVNDSTVGVMEVYSPRKGCKIYTGQGFTNINWVNRSKPYWGVGIQAVAIAMDISKEHGLEQRVGLDACYGSGNCWLKLGFSHHDSVSREEFLEAMKDDGDSRELMYLPPESAQRIVELSQNKKLLSEFYAKKILSLHPISQKK